MAYNPFTNLRTVSPLYRVGQDVPGGGAARDPGDLGPAPGPAPIAQPFTLPEMSPFDRALSVGGAAIGTYHGFKRNGSVGWAIAWGVAGAVFPVITSALAVAQGIGKHR